MRRIILLPLLTIAFIGFGRAQETASPSDAETKQEILKIEDERDKAMQNRDMPVLDRIHADDLIFVNTRGQVLNKAQYMDDIRSGNLKFLTFQQDEYHFYIHRNTAILTGYASSVVEYHGKVNRIPRRFTSVYIKRNGQWQLVAHQATLIMEK